MCDPKDNTTEVPYVDMTLHHTYYLYCKRAW